MALTTVEAYAMIGILGFVILFILFVILPRKLMR